MVQKSSFQLHYSSLVLSYIFLVLSYLGKTPPVSFIHDLWDFSPFKFLCAVTNLKCSCNWRHSLTSLSSVPSLSRPFTSFMLFFIQVSILCQKSKKLNGLKKCDWMRPFLLKGECEVQEAGLVWIEESGWMGQLWAMPLGKGEVWVLVGKCHMLASTGEWTACF